MNMKRLVLAIAATTTGLNAGLFYAYQVSVIPAFKAVSNETYIAAMQAINRAIENPAFMLSFIGSPIFLPIAAYLHRGKPSSLRFRLLVAASLLCIVGSFGITAGANVPLNEQIAQFTLQGATPDQMAVERAAFEGPWNTWHTVRTVASVGAFILTIIALLAPLVPESVRTK